MSINNFSSDKPNKVKKSILRIPLDRFFPSGTYRREKMSNIYHRLLKKSKSPDLSLSDFKKWIQINEPSTADLQNQRNESACWDYQPLISIVIPIYKTPIDILVATLNSVINQSYSNWELCIANGSPENEKINRILTNYSSNDRRFKIKTLAANRGIAANTNEAIHLATGQYVGFLDHDDLLAPFALYSVAEVIREIPDCDLIYSDEDKIDKKGKSRFNPFFKPAFSPDFLRSCNYICHFLTIRKSLGDQLGWIRDGFEGAQDYDLILRCTEKSEKIVHIPKILYHWRVLPGSTALTVDSKSYASDSGIKALSDHLTRVHRTGNILPGPSPTTYIVDYSIHNQPLVSIVILHTGSFENLRKCFSSILNRTSYPNFEILIAVNDADHSIEFPLYETLTTDQRIKIIPYQDSYKFSNINNYAVQFAKGTVLLFLDENTEIITPCWIEQMLKLLLRPDVGTVGAKLINKNNTIHHAGILIRSDDAISFYSSDVHRTNPGYQLSLSLPRNVTAVCGSCFMTRKEVFDEIGGFSCEFTHSYRDIDFCMKCLQAGYLNVWTPFAELTFSKESEKEIVSGNKTMREDLHSDIQLFQKKWQREILDGDFYYNPNLRLDQPPEINLGQIDFRPRIVDINQQQSDEKYRFSRLNSR